MRNNQKNRIRRSSLVLLVLLVLFCLVLSAAALTVYRLPEMAKQRFGPASTALTRSQKIQYSFQLFIKEQQLFAPLSPEAREKKFEISLGEPVYSITARLQQEGFVPDGEALRAYLIYSGLDTRVQAGQYRFDKMDTVIDLARSLEDPTPGDIRFIILPGWRLEEIAAALPTSGLRITPMEFLDKAYHPTADLMPEGWAKGDSLEGVLPAGEYVFPRETTVDELLGEMVAQFNRMISPEIVAGISSQGLTVKQGVTLASIVQKEAVVTDEQAAIASVFLNRLKAGMRLDSDPTVQYAVGNSRVEGTWWVNPITVEDLSIDSPYNTYIYGGLPPSPICSLSMNAIKAVTNPETTPYYYFRASCAGDGRHLFAENYDGHLQNACD